MTRTPWCLGIIAVLVNCAPLPPRAIAMGDRVRVHAARAATQNPALQQPYIGIASALTPTSITVSDSSRRQTWNIPASSILVLYVSDGRRPRWAGATTGAIIGGLVIAGIGSFAVSDEADIDRSAVTLVGGVSGAVVGGLVGLAFGGRERWRPATLPVHSGRSPTPADVVAQVDIGASPVAPPARLPNDGFRSQVSLDRPARSP